MKPVRQIGLFLLLSLLSSCIVQFIPESDEDPNLIVVEGLITDQPGENSVKLSVSLPPAIRSQVKPLKGCNVWISDDMDNVFNLKETVNGTYVTDSAKFQGSIGRSYALHIEANETFNYFTYESEPVEMKPVSYIDSLYYEKTIIREYSYFGPKLEGCQIYFNTIDPTDNCRYYRWGYSETWEFHIPFDVTNNVCWFTSNSTSIHIKNTSILQETRIERYPLLFISNSSDRLKVKYSILVNQYSLNEDEYLYWEKLQSLSEEVGGLYDIIPSTIPGNIRCVDNPNEEVLGYFSVSACSSERIFIEEYFAGIIDLYSNCIYDTIYGREPIPLLNSNYWILEDHINDNPPWRVITANKGCADCTVRGTTVKPDFWEDD